MRARICREISSVEGREGKAECLQGVCVPWDAAPEREGEYFPSSYCSIPAHRRTIRQELGGKNGR